MSHSGSMQTDFVPTWPLHGLAAGGADAAATLVAIASRAPASVTRALIVMLLLLSECVTASYLPLHSHHARPVFLSPTFGHRFNRSRKDGVARNVGKPYLCGSLD